MLPEEAEKGTTRRRKRLSVSVPVGLCPSPLPAWLCLSCHLPPRLSSLSLSLPLSRARRPGQAPHPVAILHFRPWTPDRGA